MKVSLLVAVVALAATSQVSANLLTNPGFEDPIGPEWALTIVSGTETSWTSGASTANAHSGTSSYLLGYGPIGSTGEAYIDQTVAGLTPGAAYDVSGWLFFGWRADKDWAYIEAQGGDAAVQAPAKGSNMVGSWQQYSLSQTADTGGNLTVRLDLNKYTTTTADKTAWVYFDDLVVEAAAIPEPGGVALAGLGVLALTMIYRRK